MMRRITRIVSLGPGPTLVERGDGMKIHLLESHELIGELNGTLKEPPKRDSLLEIVVLCLVGGFVGSVIGMLLCG